MSLKEILFGKEITLNDDFFGQIGSDKTRSKTAKSLSWFFKFKISNFKFETDIIAEGNYLGIDPNSKAALVDFISKFEDYYSQILDNLISIDTKKYANLIDWRNKYYISVIHPSLRINSAPANFEIFFQAYDNKNDLFMIELSNKKLDNLEIVR